MSHPRARDVIRIFYVLTGTYTLAIALVWGYRSSSSAAGLEVFEVFVVTARARRAVEDPVLLEACRLSPRSIRPGADQSVESTAMRRQEAAMASGILPNARGLAHHSRPDAPTRRTEPAHRRYLPPPFRATYVLARRLAWHCDLPMSLG